MGDLPAEIFGSCSLCFPGEQPYLYEGTTLGNSVKAAREVLVLSVLVRARVPQLLNREQGAYPNRQRDHVQTVDGVSSNLTAPTLAPVAQFGRGNRLKPGAVQVRILPGAHAPMVDGSWSRSPIR
jgi:hypothetical protein